MILQAYAVYDKAVGAYLPLFFVRTNAEAYRHFDEVCNDGRSPIAKHPEDYHLSYMFKFDDETGEVVDNQPVKAMTALECVKVVEA